MDLFILFVILGIIVGNRVLNGPRIKYVAPCAFHDWNLFNGVLRCKACGISPSDRKDNSL